MKARLEKIVDRFGLLITAILASLLAWWLFRVAGEYVFLTINAIALLLLLTQAGSDRFGRKREKSQPE